MLLNNSTFWTIVRLLRWDKPEGRLILMIPALWGVFLAANGHPPSLLVGDIILGSLATSAAGCVINDFWDRDLDPLVERTKNRPLAEKSLSIAIAIIVGICALISAFVLALFLNKFTLLLCIAAVPVIILYPLAKRVFPIPQLVLAIAWGFAVLISWSAITQELSIGTWYLWGATIFWTLGFDTVYAMSDREDDLKIGIKSSAIFFADNALVAVGCFFSMSALLLIGLGFVMELKTGYWVALLIVSIFWIWETIQLINPEHPKTIYGQIFRQNVLIGFILLTGMIIGV